MNRLLLGAGALGLTLLTAGCGSGSGSGGQPSAKPSTSLPSTASKSDRALFPATDGPSNGDRENVGPGSLAVTGEFQRLAPVRQSKSTTVSYSSKRTVGGKHAAIAVTWSTGADSRSAKSEAQLFRGQLLDVQHVKDLKMAHVSWPSLRDAYQFVYTDRNVSPQARTWVLMGETSSGQYISVTAKAPGALVDPLKVTAICGSLRARAGSSDT